MTRSDSLGVVGEPESLRRREPLRVVALIAMELLADDGWIRAGARDGGENTCVLKPSEQTLPTTLRLAKLGQQVSRLGRDMICGDGELVGTALIRHPTFRSVSLTSDMATSRQIPVAGANTRKRVHLDFGGKSPS